MSSNQEAVDASKVFLDDLGQTGGTASSDPRTRTRSPRVPARVVARDLPPPGANATQQQPSAASTTSAGYPELQALHQALQRAAAQLPAPTPPRREPAPTTYATPVDPQAVVEAVQGGSYISSSSESSNDADVAPGDLGGRYSLGALCREEEREIATYRTQIKDVCERQVNAKLSATKTMSGVPSSLPTGSSVPAGSGGRPTGASPRKAGAMNTNKATPFQFSGAPDREEGIAKSTRATPLAPTVAAEGVALVSAFGDAERSNVENTAPPSSLADFLVNVTGAAGGIGDCITRERRRIHLAKLRQFRKARVPTATARGKLNDTVAFFDSLNATLSVHSMLSKAGGAELLSSVVLAVCGGWAHCLANNTLSASGAKDSTAAVPLLFVEADGAVHCSLSDKAMTADLKAALEGLSIVPLSDSETKEVGVFCIKPRPRSSSSSGSHKGLSGADEEETPARLTAAAFQRTLHALYDKIATTNNLEDNDDKQKSSGTADALLMATLHDALDQVAVFALPSSPPKTTHPRDEEPMCEGQKASPAAVAATQFCKTISPVAAFVIAKDMFFQIRQSSSFSLAHIEQLETIERLCSTTANASVVTAASEAMLQCAPLLKAIKKEVLMLLTAATLFSYAGEEALRNGQSPNQQHNQAQHFMDPTAALDRQIAEQLGVAEDVMGSSDASPNTDNEDPMGDSLLDAANGASFQHTPLTPFPRPFFAGDAFHFFALVLRSLFIARDRLVHTRAALQAALAASGATAPEAMQHVITLFNMENGETVTSQPMLSILQSSLQTAIEALGGLLSLVDTIAPALAPPVLNRAPVPENHAEGASSAAAKDGEQALLFDWRTTAIRASAMTILLNEGNHGGAWQLIAELLSGTESIDIKITNSSGVASEGKEPTKPSSLLNFIPKTSALGKAGYNTVFDRLMQEAAGGASSKAPPSRYDLPTDAFGEQTKTSAFTEAIRCLGGLRQCRSPEQLRTLWLPLAKSMLYSTNPAIGAEEVAVAVNPGTWFEDPDSDVAMLDKAGILQHILACDETSVPEAYFELSQLCAVGLQSTRKPLHMLLEQLSVMGDDILNATPAAAQRHLVEGTAKSLLLKPILQDCDQFLLDDGERLVDSEKVQLMTYFDAIDGDACAGKGRAHQTTSATAADLAPEDIIVDDEQLRDITEACSGSLDAAAAEGQDTFRMLLSEKEEEQIAAILGVIESKTMRREFLDVELSVRDGTQQSMTLDKFKCLALSTSLASRHAPSWYRLGLALEDRPLCLARERLTRLDAANAIAQRILGLNEARRHFVEQVASAKGWDAPTTDREWNTRFQQLCRAIARLPPNPSSVRSLRDIAPIVQYAPDVYEREPFTASRGHAMTVSRVDCLVHAILCDPADGRAWFALGTCLAERELLLHRYTSEVAVLLQKSKDGEAEASPPHDGVVTAPALRLATLAVQEIKTRLAPLKVPSSLLPAGPSYSWLKAGEENTQPKIDSNDDTTTATVVLTPADCWRVATLKVHGTRALRASLYAADFPSSVSHAGEVVREQTIIHWCRRNNYHCPPFTP